MNLFSAPRGFSAIADKPAVSSRTRRHHMLRAAAACDTYTIFVAYDDVHVICVRVCVAACACILSCGGGVR